MGNPLPTLKRPVFGAQPSCGFEQFRVGNLAGPEAFKRELQFTMASDPRKTERCDWNGLVWHCHTPFGCGGMGKADACRPGLCRTIAATTGTPRPWTLFCPGRSPGLRVVAFVRLPGVYPSDVLDKGSPLTVAGAAPVLPIVGAPDSLLAPGSNKQARRTMTPAFFTTGATMSIDIKKSLYLYFTKFRAPPHPAPAPHRPAPCPE